MERWPLPASYRPYRLHTIYGKGPALCHCACLTLESLRRVGCWWGAHLLLCLHDTRSLWLHMPCAQQLLSRLLPSLINYTLHALITTVLGRR
jgi:hypothetical protein